MTIARSRSSPSLLPKRAEGNDNEITDYKRRGEIPSLQWRKSPQPMVSGPREEDDELPQIFWPSFLSKHQDDRWAQIHSITGRELDGGSRVQQQAPDAPLPARSCPPIAKAKQLLTLFSLSLDFMFTERR